MIARVVMITIGAVCAFVGLAGAGVTFEVKPADGETPPAIVAKIAGTVGTDPIVLIDESGKPATQIRASDVRVEGPTKLAVALLILGWEAWMGNDDVVAEDAPDRYVGALKGLKEGFDKLEIGKFGPAGSVGMIITYSADARIRVPMGPLGELSGSKLGTQREYYQTTGSDLVGGVRLALSELAKVEASKKLLIVIGDGSDTNNDAAKAQLQTLRKTAVAQEVMLAAFTYKSRLSADDNVVRWLAPDVKTVATVENIIIGLRSFLAEFGSTTVVTFPGYRPDRPSLVWNGKLHDLRVRIGKRDGEGKDVLFPVWQPPAPEPPRRMSWLVGLLAGFGVLGLIAGGFAMLRRFSGRTPHAAPRA